MGHRGVLYNAAWDFRWYRTNGGSRLFVFRNIIIKYKQMTFRGKCAKI